MGVKSGLKDVCRVLDVNFTEANNISKEIDGLLDKPQPKFSDFDAMKESHLPNDRTAWKKFDAIEQQYPEVFRLARRFEGVPRQMGTHASAILVTPHPVTDSIPVMINKDGYKVTLFTGEQIEELNFLKFDILGLKTITVINETLKNIDPDLTMDTYLENLDYNDPKVFKMIQKKKTDGLFQIESDMFKGLIGQIIPDKFSDIVLITSLGRPGPLSANMHGVYSDRKHGFVKLEEPVANTWDLLEETLGTIVYQEDIMRIAQRVAGFDDNQVDSYLRKSVSKKKKDLMDLCKQWFAYGKINQPVPEEHNDTDKNQPMYDPEAKYGNPIPGGISKGYDPKKLVTFFESLEGYVSYLFNKSHAATYSVLTLGTAHLKHYHPTEFMSALLSIQAPDNETRDKYVKVAREMELGIQCPDINDSGKFFTPKADEKTILYGLESIKGIGAAKLDAIIDNRPYANLEDAIDRLPKNIFNKTVGENMIKAGAFDFQCPNRYAMLNLFYALRKIKIDEHNPEEFGEDAYIIFESETLGAPVTYQPWWDLVIPNRKMTETMTVTYINERTDKKGKLMAFGTAQCNGCNVELLIFSSHYGKMHHLLNPASGQQLQLTGKKDAKGLFLVSGAKKEKNILGAL